MYLSAPKLPLDLIADLFSYMAAESNLVPREATASLDLRSAGLISHDRLFTNCNPRW
jgi:hypothetical protein